MHINTTYNLSHPSGLETYFYFVTIDRIILVNILFCSGLYDI